MENTPKNISNVNKLENNQEESVVKQGIDFVFEQNTELASIGTKEQYASYLETVFPESKLKNIVFHQGSNVIEEFNTNTKKFLSSKAKAIFFSLFNQPIPKAANFITGRGFKTSTMAAVVDIKNPLILSQKENYELAKEKYLNIEKAVRKINSGELEGYDSVIGFTFVEDDEGQLDSFSNKHIPLKYPLVPKYSNSKKDMIEIAVADPSHICILGSKQDIEKFKEFVSK